MLVCAVGHQTLTVNPSWLRGEIERVLTKLSPTSLHVGYGPGVPTDIAELAVVLGLPTELVLYDPLAKTLRRKGLDGFAERTRALVDHDLVTSVCPVPSSGRIRQRIGQRAAFLAGAFSHHVMVYDGRNNGTMLEHFQLVRDTHDVILISPTERRTVRRNRLESPRVQ
jgi:hypothetical protein